MLEISKDAEFFLNSRLIDNDALYVSPVCCCFFLLHLLAFGSRFFSPVATCSFGFQCVMSMVGNARSR